MATATLELTKEQKKLLKSIEKGTKGNGSMIVDTSDDLAALFNANKVVGKETEEGKVEVKLIVGEQPSASKKPAVDVQVDSADDFPIDLNQLKESTKKPEAYPFSKLNVGDSFLIPVSDQTPEPWNSLTSTVSSANRRYSKDDPSGAVKKNRDGKMVPKLVYERKFKLKRVAKGDTYKNGRVEAASGARIFRIQ